VNIVQLDDVDRETMLKLKNKNYLTINEYALLLGLIDILFGYCYEYRVSNGGEFGPESSWTVCRLSATLSWFDRFTSIPEVVISSMRRSLCFPLYRNWRLAITVLDDVISIFLLGKKALVRELLQIKRLLDKGDVRRHLSVLYIDDYCVWVQQLNDEKLSRFSEALQRAGTPKKEDCGWPLTDLEREAEEHRNEFAVQ